MVVAADAADAAGDEMGVARVFALHENAVAAKDRRRAMAFDDVPIGEIDLREDPQAADDPRDRIPIHLDDVLRPGFGRLSGLMAVATVFAPSIGDVVASRDVAGTLRCCPSLAAAVAMARVRTHADTAREVRAHDYECAIQYVVGS